MNAHRRPSTCSRVVPGFIPPAAFAVLTAMMVGCGGEGTTSAFQPPDPQFAKPSCPGHPSCGDDGGDDGGGTGAALQFDLVDPAGIAGVYSDGQGPYPSTMLDDDGGVHPTCDVREIDLRDVVTPDETVITQDEINAILTNQSRCDGASGDPRRAFLKAPGILTLTEDCDSDPNTATADCPFDTYPSYEWKGNRIKPTGGFSNAARHFEEDTVTGDLLTWVFQDPKVTVAKDEVGTVIAWTFQATTIHLYGHPDWELCIGGGDADKDGVPENCLNFALSADFTIEPEGS